MLQNYSSNHIDMEVGGLGDEMHWRMTFFYGFPVGSEKYKSWRLIETLHGNSSLSWVCLGDFNEILKANGRRLYLVGKKLYCCCIESR